MFRITTLILLLALILTFSSCVTYDSLVNYNESPEVFSAPHNITNFEPIKIQPSDILQIQVSSTDPAAAAPFNLSMSGGANNSRFNNSVQDGGAVSGFLVNQDGTIDFPTLGPVNIENLSVDEAKAKIFDLLKPYFTVPPIINVRLANFRVNVTGEVKNPGIFSISNNRVTVIEAVTMAGDFTDHSMRDSILIVREADGLRSFGYVNFNSADIFNSPYFYLQQNDMVYVRPERRKTAIIRDPITRVTPFVSAITSFIAIVVTVIRFTN